MAKLTVTLIQHQEEKQLYGLWHKSSDKTQSKDIPEVSKKYYEVLHKKPGMVLPFYVLSKNYDETTNCFDLFIGGQDSDGTLSKLNLPKGMYAKITVKPKIGVLWGLAIGEAKRYFYTKWLPSSGFQAVNMEYEYHTEKSTGKKPEIDLMFAIKQ